MSVERSSFGQVQRRKFWRKPSCHHLKSVDGSTDPRTP